MDKRVKSLYTAFFAECSIIQHDKSFVIKLGPDYTPNVTYPDDLNFIDFDICVTIHPLTRSNECGQFAEGIVLYNPEDNKDSTKASQTNLSSILL